MKTPVEWNQTELSVSACFTSVSKLSDLSLTLTKGQRPLCLYVLETRVMEKQKSPDWRDCGHVTVCNGSPVCDPHGLCHRFKSRDNCQAFVKCHRLVPLGPRSHSWQSLLEPGGSWPPHPIPPPRAVPLVLRRFHIMSRPDGPDWTQETSDCVETRTKPDDETKRRRFHLFLAVGLQVPIPPLTLFTKLSLTFAVMTLNNRNTWGCRQSAAHHFTVSVVISEGLHRGDAHRVFFLFFVFF